MSAFFLLFSLSNIMPDIKLALGVCLLNKLIKKILMDYYKKKARASHQKDRCCFKESVKTRSKIQVCTLFIYGIIYARVTCIKICKEVFILKSMLLIRNINHPETLSV